jgi:hypothetical protein
MRKGIASEAGKALWAKTTALLGWTKQPEAKEIPREIAIGESQSSL